MSRYCENGGCTRPAVTTASVKSPELNKEVFKKTVLCEDCLEFLVKTEQIEEKQP